MKLPGTHPAEGTLVPPDSHPEKQSFTGEHLKPKDPAKRTREPTARAVKRRRLGASASATTAPRRSARLATFQAPQVADLPGVPDKEAPGPAQDDQPRLKRVPLTKENLKQWTQMSKRKSTAGHSVTDSPSATTKSVSSTSAGFDIIARKNGILNRKDSRQPINFDEAFERLDRARGSESPPESAWKQYVDDMEDATNEAGVIAVTNSLLVNYSNRAEWNINGDYTRLHDQGMTALPNGLGFNRGLSAPQPDSMEGLKVSGFRPFPIEEVLGGAAVLVKDAPNSVALPHLAGEYKGPGKDMLRARTQAGYAGAALVHGRNKALEYLGEPDPEGYAAVTTYTTDGTTLNLFSHFADTTAPDQFGGGAAVQYHQYPRGSCNMTWTYDEWKKGRRWIRNAQDDARENAFILRDRLQRHWIDSQGRGTKDAAESAGAEQHLPEEDVHRNDGPAGEYAYKRSRHFEL